MTTLSNIQPAKGSQTRSRSVSRGRGTGRGGTNGRGMNGQNSRTGQGKRYPHFEGGQSNIFMRTPKRKGFTAYKPDEFVIVNLDQLEKLAENNVKMADYAVLYEQRIIRAKGKFLKVLGRGKLSKKIDVVADVYSESAKKAIEKAGGKAVTTIDDLMNADVPEAKKSTPKTQKKSEVTDSQE